MSSTCIYQEFDIRIKADDIGFDEDQFLLVGLVGSSNSFVGNKRARSWSVYAAGSHASVMANVINAASSCDGEGLRLGSFGNSGRVLGETYISKVRRKLKNASECEPLKLKGSIQGLAVLVHPKHMNSYSPEEERFAALVSALMELDTEFRTNYKSDVSRYFTVHGVTDY